eukprot:jgi/Botrbrau1/1160/Bobra.0162s0048.1
MLDWVHGRLTRGAAQLAEHDIRGTGPAGSFTCDRVPLWYGLCGALSTGLAAPSRFLAFPAWSLSAILHAHSCKSTVLTKIEVTDLSMLARHAFKYLQG